MSSSVGRFNLRTRKSLKLNGQIECSSCKRFYFPPEYLDIDDENELQTKQICCDCEERQQQQPPAKRQRKNGPADIAVKQEPIDYVIQPHVYYDRQPRLSLQTIPIEKENGRNVVKKANPGMVQIHSIELLSNSPVALTNNSPQEVKVKMEKISSSPVIKVARSKRALRNKTNTIQPKDEEKPKDEEPNKTIENVITKTDTEDSLRLKFPNASAFEFEFLMFLKAKIVP